MECVFSDIVSQLILIQDASIVCPAFIFVK